MNTISIEIPVGKEVDWEESKKQNIIVLKNKQMNYDEVRSVTYEEIRSELLKTDFYFISNSGDIEHGSTGHTDNCAKTSNQLECLLSLNKLINTAIYLNGNWKPHSSLSSVYSIVDNYGSLRIDKYDIDSPEISGRVIFKSEELAKQAIEILGIPTIKMALSTYF